MFGVAAEGNDPKLQWTLRSSLDLTDAEFDVSVRHVSALPNPGVPAYTAVDARCAWRVRRDLELSVVGQNLFDPGHPEFGAEPGRSEIARGAYVKLRWTF